jgi:hypothetical protein
MYMKSKTLFLGLTMIVSGAESAQVLELPFQVIIGATVPALS